MLNNLKAEYVRKGIEPYKGIVEALKCTAKTARNKLNGESAVTVPEACKIIRHSFCNDDFTIEYLFSDSNNSIFEKQGKSA
ncbi:MAG: hypothetical protein HFE49_00080 [Clostridia bacterium]|nr:hypothetical protein [Clostridia bacterium]